MILVNEYIIQYFMQENKLHLELPPIIGYLHHAYHLSIAQEHPDFQDWFNCNYIQMKYYSARGWLNFYSLDILYNYYPLLDLEVLSNRTIKSCKIDIIEFIVNCIDNGYYVWLYLDEYYDPGKKNYKEVHHKHEYLLYGYNDKSELHTVGFNNQSVYAFYEIGFDNFLTAYNSIEENFEIKMLRPNIKNSYEFDVFNTKDILDDYINSRDTSIRNRMFGTTSSDIVYGLDIYKHMRINLEDPKNSNLRYDIRPLHIMWEHKKCMTSRIKFLYEKNHINNYKFLYSEYEKIEERVLSLRNLQLKFIVTGKEDLIKKLTNSFDEIRKQEKKILIELMESIH